MSIGGNLETFQFSATMARLGGHHRVNAIGSRAQGARTVRPRIALLLLLLIGSAGAQQTPLTPYGVAVPNMCQGMTADSAMAGMARRGTIAHQPLALAASRQALAALERDDHETAAGSWQRARSHDPGYFSPALARLLFGPWTNARTFAGHVLELPEALFGTFLSGQVAASNFLILFFFPFLLGLTAVAILIFCGHAARVHHLFWENLCGFLPRRFSKWATWGLLLLPLFWNFGFLLWAGLLLGAAYPMLAHRERRLGNVLLGTLVVAPLLINLMAIISAPSDPAHPVHAIWRAQRSGENPAMRVEIESLSARHPDYAALYLSESLLARQAGDLDAARAALEQAEPYAPIPASRFDAIRGILAFRDGNIEEAIRALHRAAEADPKRYILRYNLSKAYARASLFLKADREMHQAFQLNASKVRVEERRRLQEQADDLIEERLGRLDLWKILLREGPRGGFQLPVPLALLFPGRDARLLWPGILLIPFVAWGSHRWHRRLRIHVCSRCGKTVCRRCLERRERRVYCAECALTAERWSRQSAQVLLTKLLGRHDRLRDRIIDGARVILPGVGAVLRGRVWRGMLQLQTLAGAIFWLGCDGLPLKPLPWTALEHRLLPAMPIGWAVLVLLLWVVIQTELRGLRKRSTLKEFLGAAIPRKPRRRAA